MNWIKLLWKALKYGQQLGNSADWKHRQNTANALTGLLGVAVAAIKASGHDFAVSDADVVLIAGGIAAGLGLFNATITTSTSAKIGLPSGGASVDERPVDIEPPRAVPEQAAGAKHDVYPWG